MGRGCSDVGRIGEHCKGLQYVLECNNRFIADMWLEVQGEAMAEFSVPHPLESRTITQIKSSIFY